MVNPFILFSCILVELIVEIVWHIQTSNPCIFQRGFYFTSGGRVAFPAGDILPSGIILRVVPSRHRKQGLSFQESQGNDCLYLVFSFKLYLYLPRLLELVKTHALFILMSMIWLIFWLISTVISLTERFASTETLFGVFDKNS